jgi:Omp85 superfamily domain
MDTRRLAPPFAFACAAWAMALAMGSGFARAADEAPPDAASPPAASPPAASPAAPAPVEVPPKGIWSWLNPSTAPFIPIPEIDVDPNSGTTLGVIPTRLVTNDRGEITKIIAPAIDHNPYFGVGARVSIYSYPSDDTQWNAVVGAKERVESQFDYEYLTGRLREKPLTFALSVVYDRSGTPRFYGIGNDSPVYNETNYTLQQKYVQGMFGWNLTHIWQISYTFRARDVQVQPGTLVGIPSLEGRFGSILGVGTTHETLNRVEIIYDSRDDTTVPTRGGEYVLYGGVAAASGILDSSLYSVTGLDARQLWSLSPGNIIAAHMALRYMPGATNVPFWSLSNIGGDRSVIAENQPLRGFGEGRFYSRNLFSASVEYRKQVLSVDAVSSHVNVELTPFVDVGEVFAHSRESPVAHLHHVGGLGFRGIAAPYVVGYVDVGYGSEGVAVFTGINYPF